MNESVISRIAEEEDSSIENLGSPIQMDETPEGSEEVSPEKRPMSADELLVAVSREKYAREVEEETSDEDGFFGDLEEDEYSSEEDYTEEDELEEDFEGSPRLIRAHDIVRAISSLRDYSPA